MISSFLPFSGMRENCSKATFQEAKVSTTSPPGAPAFITARLKSLSCTSSLSVELKNKIPFLFVKSPIYVLIYEEQIIVALKESGLIQEQRKKRKEKGEIT